MRWLGLDVGTRTIGVAICDEGEVVASPLRTLPRHGGERDIRAVAELLEQTGAAGLVIGLPLELSGAEGDAALRVRRLGAQLARAIDGVQVEYWDERFSTAAAERALLEADLGRQRRKQAINHVAAALILQSFLDRAAAAGRGGPGQPGCGAAGS